jgi:hypothetical protein
MDGACGKYGEEEMCVQGFCKEIWAKETTWKTQVQVGERITMNHQESGCEGRNGIDLVKYRDKWQALVKTVMNFQVL